MSKSPLCGEGRENPSVPWSGQDPSPWDPTLGASSHWECGGSTVCGIRPARPGSAVSGPHSRLLHQTGHVRSQPGGEELGPFSGSNCSAAEMCEVDDFRFLVHFSSLSLSCRETLAFSPPPGDERQQLDPRLSRVQQICAD